MARRLVDGGVAVVVAVPTGLDAWWSPAGSRESDLWSYVLVLLPAAALLVRRRWPIGVASVCAFGLLAWYVAGYRGELTGLPLAVTLYTIARQGDRRLSVMAGVGTLVLFTVLAVVAGDFGLPATGGALPIAALLLGETARNREELLAEQALRAERTHRERETQARDRAHRERLRLAQELHDVMAHTVTAMTVQAGVAVEAFDRRPEMARGALGQVRALGRDAIAELRAAVAVLRADRGAGSTAPAPGLPDLGSLADGVRSTGLQVTLAVHASDVPPTTGLVAYRTVQEALTNVLRHADASLATVTVKEDATTATRGLTIEVLDDGRGGPPAGDGFGLRGISERAAGMGGTAKSGPRSDSTGYRVQVWLPLPAAVGAA